ncbi:MAG TPA: AraC family transcriptional regulator [Clostridia bacterium]|nr:AraC family transcriptional regulator [Clostridia bacterium]
MFRAVHRVDSVSLEPHVHHAYELIYVQQGRMRIDFSDRSYEAGPHTLVAVNHLEEHTVTILETPYDRYFVMLPPRQADAWVGSRVLLSLFTNRPSAFSHVLDVRRVASQLSHLFRNLEREQVLQDAPFFDLRVGALLRLLLSTVYRDQPAAFPVVSETARDPVFEVQTVMDHQFDQDLSIHALAEQVYLSESALSHRFHAQTGMSPKQYLTLTRLTHAKYLLLSSKLTVGEVCERCGFGDVNNFIRRFRREYGCTPGTFRANASVET